MVVTLNGQNLLLVQLLVVPANNIKQGHAQTQYQLTEEPTAQF